MPSVVHIVTTANFAGVERYVCNVAGETAGRGWDVAVVGGHPERMPAALGGDVRWEPGATAFGSIRSVVSLGDRDFCHAHMTKAEAVAVATRRLHRASVVSTRHFAAPRGASRAGRMVAPRIAHGLEREIAVSDFVARRLERWPSAVVLGGVRSSPCLWRPASRVVLVLQRLEAEKETQSALQAWQLSHLVDDGWTLRVVGEGAQRASLEAWAAREGVAGVVFVGWTANVQGELEGAGMLLATAPAEPFGLSVVEAMAAGVPVVACGAGGHLETVGLLSNAAVFPPRDVAAAAGALRSLLPDPVRAEISSAGRRLVADRFTLEGHVDQLLAQYDLCSVASRS